MAKLTKAVSYTGTPDADILTEFGFRFSTTSEFNDKHEMVTTPAIQAFAKYLPEGEEQPKEIVRSVTAAQVASLTVLQVRALVIAAIKTDLGV